MRKEQTLTNKCITTPLCALTHEGFKPTYVMEVASVSKEGIGPEWLS